MYNHAGKLAGYTKSEDSIQTANWSFYYGPFGLEKAYRSTSPTITEDFTTAPDGRILSMTYTEAGGSYNGEYQYHFDNFGNTILLTNASGVAKYSALYDLHSGKLMEEWNPNGLTLVNKIKGFNGSINFVFDNFNIIFNNSCGSAINLISSFSNIGIGGETVKPLIWVAPGSVGCTESCKKAGLRNEDGNVISDFTIVVYILNDIDNDGNFSPENIKKLKKEGLNDFQINALGDFSRHCRDAHYGGKVICSSIVVNDPKNTSGHCCLTCECRTILANGTGSGSDTICEDYWILR